MARRPVLVGALRGAGWRPRSWDDPARVSRVIWRHHAATALSRPACAPGLVPAPGGEDFVASLDAVESPEGVLLSARELRDLPVPAALIWGLADSFLPRGSLEFFRANLPAAPTLLLKHCGHLPQQERPRAVARFIHQYAEQLAVAPPVPQGASGHGKGVRELGSTRPAGDEAVLAGSAAS